MSYICDFYLFFFWYYLLAFFIWTYRCVFSKGDYNDDIWKFLILTTTIHFGRGTALTSCMSIQLEFNSNFIKLGLFKKLSVTGKTLFVLNIPTKLYILTKGCWRWATDGSPKHLHKAHNCDNKPFSHHTLNQYCGFLRFNISMVLIILATEIVVVEPKLKWCRKVCMGKWMSVKNQEIFHFLKWLKWVVHLWQKGITTREPAQAYVLLNTVFSPYPF